MKKQIINNAEERLNIVILKNDNYGIIAKGISRCHPDDDYNEEVGQHIANSRAWLKYYEKLQKYTTNELEWVEDTAQHYAERVNQLKEVRQNAVDKYNEIIADYNETLKTL